MFALKYLFIVDLGLLKLDNIPKINPAHLETECTVVDYIGQLFPSLATTPRMMIHCNVELPTLIQFLDKSNLKEP
jgi:hypothetical protein